MPASIVDQNKALSSAAKTPKDTSKRGDESLKYSAKVSSSKLSSKSSSSEPQQRIQRSSGKVIKGSYEGLMNGSSTVLQFKGSGYDSKAAQSAKMSSNFQSHNTARFGFNSFTSNKNYSIMNNYTSITGRDTSSGRLSEIVRNNMNF